MLYNLPVELLQTVLACSVPHLHHRRLASFSSTCRLAHSLLRADVQTAIDVWCETFGFNQGSDACSVRLHGPGDLLTLSGLITKGSLRAVCLSVRCDFGDTMATFARAIARGLASLKQLSLSGNQIGDDHMTEFSRVIASGSLGALTFLALGGNKIGDAGMTALAGVASGSLPNLKELWLDGNQIGDAGMVGFSRAIASGSMASLQHLYLSFNQIATLA